MYAPLQLPDEAQELDLLVCLPPPDGNLDHLTDGSYPTDYCEPDRHRSGSTTAVSGEYEVRSSGGSPGTSATTPAGAHLYLLWWYVGDQTTPPTPAPLSLVPQGMVAGSTAPNRGVRALGHWSAWQEYGVRRFPWFYGRYSTDIHGVIQQSIGHNADGTETDWPNVETILDADLASIRSGGGVTPITDVITQEGLAGFHAQKHNRFAAHPGIGYSISTVINQEVGTYVDPGHVYDLDDFPPLLDTLEYGVDYLEPPTNPAPPPGADPDTVFSYYVEYDGLNVRLGWEDWNTKLAVSTGAVGLTDAEYGHFNARLDTDYINEHIDGFEVTIRFAAIPTTVGWTPVQNPSYPQAGTRIPTSYIEWGDGTELASHTTHLGTGDGYLADITIALSELGNIGSFTVFNQPEFLGSRDQPIADFPCVLDETNASIFVDYYYNYGIATWTAGLSSQQMADPDHFGQVFETRPVVRYQHPQFRYWVPGPKPAYIPLGDLAIQATDRPPIIFW
jgi:hypothetical protein